MTPIAGMAGATTSPQPKVSKFAASPAKLYDSGGIVTLSATVTNAESCLFTSNHLVTGLPASVACTSGAVSQTVAVAANTGEKPVKYTFELTVTGTKTVKAKSVKVTVGTSLPPPLTGVRSVVSDQYGYCAVLSTGGMDCWGDNSGGELGNGTTADSDTAQPVTGITHAVSATSGGDGGYCAVLSTVGWSVGEITLAARWVMGPPLIPTFPRRSRGSPTLSLQPVTAAATALCSRPVEWTAGETTMTGIWATELPTVLTEKVATTHPRLSLVHKCSDAIPHR